MNRSDSTDSAAAAARNLGPLVGAIDQGTSGSRFMVFSAHTAELITYHQIPVLPDSEHASKGWLQVDPRRLLSSVEECIERTVENIEKLHLDPWDIEAIGITNQRESVILWDKNSGEPLYPAILWCDARTEDSTLPQLLASTPPWKHDYATFNSGLPLSSNFSAIKVKWLIDNVPEVRSAIREGRALFGTVDTWLLWNLTEDPKVHATDVSNASRTSLMNIETLSWDKNLCDFFGVPMEILPEIRSSSEIYGNLCRGRLAGVPISGVIGDQQAALVGQKCLLPGEIKATYGSGCFILMNIGHQIHRSTRGLLTTVAYKAGRDSPPVYALEGGAPFAGGALDWLRDLLRIEDDEFGEEQLPNSDVTFVPAFSGLFAPHWRPDARGAIFGLNRCSSRRDLFRATLEAIAFQTRDILHAMEEEMPAFPPGSLLVDGGLTEKTPVMQILADILGLPVLKPSMCETSALGAAIMAGRAEGIELWDTRLESPSAHITLDRFLPRLTREEGHAKGERWRNALGRTLRWTSQEPQSEPSARLHASIPASVFFISGFFLLILAEVMKQH